MLAVLLSNQQWRIHPRSVLDAYLGRWHVSAAFRHDRFFLVLRALTFIALKKIQHITR